MSDAQTFIGAEAHVNKLGVPAVILLFQNGSMQAKVSIDARQLDEKALMGLWTLLAQARDRALQLEMFEGWDAIPALDMPDGSLRCTYAEDHGGSVEDVVQCEWEANHSNALHSFQPSPVKSNGRTEEEWRADRHAEIVEAGRSESRE